MSTEKVVCCWSLAALMALGCGRERSAPVQRTGDTLAPPYNSNTIPPDSPLPPAPTLLLPRRASVLLDSVRIEGDIQPERLTLVSAPPAFSPPFSTYVPEGLNVEFDAISDTAASVRFIAAFAGQVNRAAYLQVRLYRPGAAELPARNAVESFLRGRDPRGHAVQSTDRWPWSVATWHFQYSASSTQGGFLGSIALARHGNRYLHVLAHYPAEYGDGVGPRFQRILEEWRWEDDGEWLIPRR